MNAGKTNVDTVFLGLQPGGHRLSAGGNDCRSHARRSTRPLAPLSQGANGFERNSP